MKGSVKKFQSNGVSFSIEKKRNKVGKFFSIYKLIKEYRPDIVVSNFSYANSALLLGTFLGVKMNIVWMHTLSNQLKNNFFQRIIKRWFLGLSQKIVVNSPLLENDLRENYGVRGVPIYSLPFWSSLNVQPKALNSGIEIFKIGCPGRLEDTKNQEYMLDWLFHVKNSTRYKLFFAGGGANLSILTNKVHRYGLQSRVEFLGTLGMDEMKVFYEEMDLIVLPSQFESFGLVLIEALSMNKPVLVSNMFGALSYIDEEAFKAKYTFSPNEIEDFDKRLNRLLSNKSLRSYEFYDIYRTFFNKKVIFQKFLDLINQ